MHILRLQHVGMGLYYTNLKATNLQQPVKLCDYIVPENQSTSKVGFKCFQNWDGMLTIYEPHVLASQLTPHPQPPAACGLSVTRNVEPINSVAKSSVAPLKRERDVGSMRTFEGAIVGRAKWLKMAETWLVLYLCAKGK